MNRIINALPALAIFGTVVSGPAYAVCESALVLSTYNKQLVYDSDWRVADLVTQETYEQIKHDAGANAVIYGVPVGANYSDFKDAVARARHQHDESLKVSQLVSIAWTGLDANSVDAYRACLNTTVFLSNGLHAAVVAATKTDYTIVVKWFVPGHAAPASVTWTAANVGGKIIPSNFNQGETAITIPRPANQISLAANYAGYATEVLVLEPLPPPPPAVSIGNTLVDLIDQGHVFVYTSANTLPGGHIGTLYPNRSLNGTFTRGTFSWRVWGPNSPDGHLVDATYCPTCQPGGGAIDPKNKQLDIWGAVFKFDDLGKVYDQQGNFIGYISAH